LPTCHFSAISCLHVDEGRGDTLGGVEFAEAARRLGEVFQVVAVSPPYPDRGPSSLVRVYAEFRL
jgi:hypothetical protein